MRQGLSLCLLALAVVSASTGAAVPVGERVFDVGAGNYLPNPTVGIDGSGGLVVVWVRDDTDEVRVRRLDAAGGLLGSEIVASTAPAFYGPALAVDPSGSFVAAWTGFDGSNLGVVARRFDATGTPLAAEFQVNVATTGYQTYPSAAPLPGGGFAVVWQSVDASAPGIRARRYDASGTPLTSEEMVQLPSPALHSLPVAASDAAGNLTIAWIRYQSGIPNAVFRRFDPAGAPLGGETMVGTGGRARRVGLAMNAAGAFVVVWSEERNENSVADILARVHDSTGTPIGSEVPVNTPLIQSDINRRPTAAMNAAGGFVVAFHGTVVSPGVRARRFDAAAIPLGPIFKANIGSFAAPGGIVMDASGQFTVVWDELAAVRGRRYADPAAIRMAGKPLVVGDSPVPSRRRIVFRSEDPNVSTAPTVAPNPITDGAALQVFNGAGTGESACFLLPAAGWTVSGSPESPVYVYSDPVGAHGPCRRASLRGGRRPMIKATCRATTQPIPYSLDEPSQGSMAVTFASGSASYCSLFGGTIVTDSATAGRFSARNAPAPAACPIPPVACP